MAGYLGQTRHIAPGSWAGARQGLGLGGSDAPRAADSGSAAADPLSQHCLLNFFYWNRYKI